ncbi:MAG: NAD-dependent epimerase/dehydratase family protein [Patescibacteria group bacterium]
MVQTTTQHQTNLNHKLVLVTGGAGFVASHLIDKLLDLGARVVGVDNFVTGRKQNLPQHPDFKFIEADAIQPPEQYLVKPELDLDQPKFDYIFHLASPASPPRYQEYPQVTYRVNSFGTDRLLEYLKKTNPRGMFIYASSSEVYGDPEVHPQTEDYWGNVNPNGVRSCYDEGKRMGETICGVYSREFDLDVRIARIFNTYGPRLNPQDGRVISNFIKQAIAHQSISIYGDGAQTRSYCFVTDLVAGLIELATNPSAKGQTINLGNPDEYTVIKTAEIIWQAVTGESIKSDQIQYMNLPGDDPARRQPDISKAQELLGWSPQVTFADGLKRTVEFFRKNE